MGFSVITPEQQVLGAFDGGKIEERKPIGFPSESGGMKPFSCLFYWAYAWSEAGGKIGMHPHQGFEIGTFVLSGNIEHYDTKINRWQELGEGDAQIIRAGSGISHAERMKPGSSFFQIWFDPGLQRTLSEESSYSDYRAEQFPCREENGVESTVIIGPGSPFTLVSPVRMERLRFSPGRHQLSIPENKQGGIFLYKGSLKSEETFCPEKGFIRVSGMDTFSFTSEESVHLFCIWVPESLAYATYIEGRRSRS